MAKRLTKAERAEIANDARAAAHRCSEYATAEDAGADAEHVCPYRTGDWPREHALWIAEFLAEVEAIFGESPAEATERYDREFRELMGR